MIILNALWKKYSYRNGSTCDWLYVEDHADALLLVLEKGTIGRSYNIGGENECTNLDLAYMICKILDRLRPLRGSSYRDLVEFVKDRPGHDVRYAIDPSRIRNELGFLHDTRDGSRKTGSQVLEMNLAETSSLVGID